MKLGISNQAIRRIAQEQLSDLALAYEMFISLIDTFVHCSEKPLLQRHTGYVTQFVPVDEYLKVEHYGSYFNFVDLSNAPDIQDLQHDIISKLEEQYENGCLSNYSLYKDIEFFREEDHGEWEDLVEVLDPEDIVTTAGMWDNPEFVEWFWEVFGLPAVQLTDGAIVIDLSQLDRVVSVEVDKFYAYVDSKEQE